MIWIIMSVVEFVIIIGAIWVAKDYKNDASYWASCCSNAESRDKRTLDYYNDLWREVHKLKRDNKELKAFIFANLKEVYAKEKKENGREE